MRDLILASGSSARQHLLSTLGIPFRVVVSHVDENMPASMSVETMVRELALKKARAVSQLHAEAIIIGADQLVSFQSVPFSKPESAAEATAQLQRLNAHTHQIFTGLCVKRGVSEVVEVDEARLTLFQLSTDEVEAYVNTNEWQGCAGSYRIEARGQWLFENIEGDRTAIQGLPMQRLVKMLRTFGLSVPSR
jgi:septum formation protein